MACIYPASRRLLQAAPGVTFSVIQVNLVQEPGVSIDHAIMRSQVKDLAAVIPPILKLVLVLQKTLTEPALRLTTPHLINLDVDPKEREPYNYPHLHSWVGAHALRLMASIAGA